MAEKCIKCYLLCPRNSWNTGRHSALLNTLAQLQRAHLSIEVVCEACHKLTLYRLLSGEQGEVVGELVVSRDDCPLPKLVKLRPSSSSKDLEHIQDSQVHKGPLLCIIDLSSL